MGAADHNVDYFGRIPWFAYVLVVVSGFQLEKIQLFERGELMLWAMMDLDQRYERYLTEELKSNSFSSKKM